MMASDFKLILRINVHESGDIVCFKQDGQRFEQSHTLKFNTDTEYDLTFTLHPALHMNKLMINGEHCKLDLCHDNKDEYEDMKTYKALYETVGYDISKRGKRKEMHFVCEFENDTYMKFSLQCKMYKSGETEHTHWGQKLAGVELDCRMEDGHNYIAVVKEKYL